MGYPTKVQLISRSKGTNQWYINFPTPLAEAMDGVLGGRRYRDTWQGASQALTLPDSLPWRARDFVALAAQLSEGGQRAEAATQLERALLRDPADADARFQLGMVKLKQGRGVWGVAACSRTERRLRRRGAGCNVQVLGLT